MWRISANSTPLRLKLAFLNAGLVCPEAVTACELGSGQGMSANLHAAATVAGTGARLYDEAFANFAARDDLPEFGYIGLHGIWSWISDDNRICSCRL
ncbi:MAG: hypothetical protein VR70_07880 [Rhodospirillaceae bacterium BRH_c57]|nr:MAG: hypothetical protein VR70_07880 [Rhodospirillaceae bacterium BRH_c57]